ncbi:hypothetical protein LI82_04065 [Methanococcoides methylutens]|uniref:Uncharacterized protein n=1 Tax=Methanococcoides methylutens TaxID=2226 RepID=A0A099T220_METMT|nr:hypothetical protein [Methanococcoides methylutens]KGK99210.1 hypothetical protein LI82_04065 [Methanococcoides methylutens]
MISETVDKNFVVLTHDENPTCINHLYGCQPGTGKTEMVVDEIASNPDKKYLYLGDNHQLIQETYNRINEKNPEVESDILEGFKRSCEILQDEQHPEYKRVLKLYDNEVPPANICIRVDCFNEECKYRRQWQDIRGENGEICKTVLAPINYTRIFNFNDFEKVFIDEGINSNGRPRFSYKKTEVFDVLDRKLKKQISETVFGRTVKNIICEDGEQLLHDAEELDEAIFNYNKMMCELNKSKSDRQFINSLIKIKFSQIGMFFAFKKAKLEEKYEEEMYLKQMLEGSKQNHEKRKTRLIDNCTNEMACNNRLVEGSKYELEFGLITVEMFEERKKEGEIRNIALETKLKNDLEIVNKLSEKVDKSIKNSNKKLENLDISSLSMSWHELIMFKQMGFDGEIIFTDTKLQFTCESFIKEIEKFQKMFPRYKHKTIYHYTDETNKNSLIIMKEKKNGYYKSYINKDVKKAIQKINKIKYNNKQRHPDKKICILTYKHLITDDEHADPNKMYKYLGLDAFWWHGSGGVNKFAHYDILIVLGTPMPPEGWYEEQWEALYGDEPMPELVFDDSGTSMLPIDEKLREMFESHWFGAIYNSVHRVRPLQYDTQIYWFGKNLPKQLERELSIKMEF